MAWLEEHRSGTYHVAFRIGDEKYKKSLRTRDEKTANARLHRVEENIALVESGRLAIPDDADLMIFLLSDGKLNGKVKPQSKVRTLSKLCAAFFNSIPDGSLEPLTIKGMKTHTDHLKRILWASLLIRELKLENLQRYVDKRAKEPGRRGQTVSPVTIKKEITTLRTIWNWAMTSEHVSFPLPQKGLRYPKTVEKPPFQTWEEIERTIARGGLAEHEIAELWDSLLLTMPEVAELLSHVESRARHPFLYPMFTFSAHTGARRSELVRSRIDDIDLAGRFAFIREKKRVRGKVTTRKVPLSPILCDVLNKWFSVHPGGQYTFCLESDVPHSRKRRSRIIALTGNEAHDHFERTLEGSKWGKVRGWHVFRHTFCSNCAARGIDQRVINEWVGHQTEEMVKRYRHLFPNQQHEAIEKVFGRVQISGAA